MDLFLLLRNVIFLQSWKAWGQIEIGNRICVLFEFRFRTERTIEAYLHCETEWFVGVSVMKLSPPRDEGVCLLSRYTLRCQRWLRRLYYAAEYLTPKSVRRKRTDDGSADDKQLKFYRKGGGGGGACTGKVGRAGENGVYKRVDAMCAASLKNELWTSRRGTGRRRILKGGKEHRPPWLKTLWCAKKQL